MEMYVLDKELNLVGVLSGYEAIIWRDMLAEPGKFEAEFLFTEKINGILQRTNILYKKDEMQAGIISYKHIKLDKQGRTKIRIKGNMASVYLRRRIVWDKMVLSGTSEEVMRKLVEKQVIDPADQERRMRKIRLGQMCGIDDYIEKQATYSNLQETLTDIAAAAGLGYRLRLDLNEKAFYFDVIKGADRTLGAEKPCIFSRDFHNVYTEEYYEDDSNFRNVCLVCGTGEDENRVTETVGEASGIDRYEMSYSASFLKDEGQTDEVYREQLRQKGNEKLKDYYLVESFTSKVRKDKLKECALGDLVTCNDKKWGIRIDTQIKVIEKNLSKDEQEVYFTFGNSRPMLANLIKAAIK